MRIAAAPLGNPATTVGDERLEQLETAREADRVWRAGRKAELERLINRALWQGLVLTMGATATAILAVRALAPQAPRPEAFWPWLIWDLGGVFLPPVVSWVVGSALAKQLQPLVAEKQAYEPKPADPVVGRSRPVNHPKEDAVGTANPHDP